MIINITGQKVPDHIKMTINFFEIPDKFNLFSAVTYGRKVKQCNILYISKELKKRLGYLFGLFRFMVKYPHSPSVIYDLSNKTIQKASFDNAYGHPDWIYKERIHKERINWLKKNCTGNVLEVGCATGYIIDYVGGGIGIDIDKLRLEYAKNSRRGSIFLEMDATDMDFKSKSFDTILIPEILEHVDILDSKKIIKECSRVGKKLLITVPNGRKLNYNKKLVENPEHKWHPTIGKMTGLLGWDGLTIKESKKKDFILLIKEVKNGRRRI